MKALLKYYELKKRKAERERKKKMYILKLYDFKLLSHMMYLINNYLIYCKYKWYKLRRSPLYLQLPIFNNF